MEKKKWRRESEEKEEEAKRKEEREKRPNERSKHSSGRTASSTPEQHFGAEKHSLPQGVYPEDAFSVFDQKKPSAGVAGRTRLAGNFILT